MLTRRWNIIHNLRFKAFFVLLFLLTLDLIINKEVIWLIHLLNFTFIFLFFSLSNVLRRIRSKNETQFIILLFWFSLIVRISVATAISIYFKVSYDNFLGNDPRDELTYYNMAIQFSRGNFKDLSVDSDLGASLYYGILAFLTSGNIVLMKLLNSIVASFIPILSYFFSKCFLNVSEAKLVGVASVLFPTYLIHCGFLFKESFMLVLVLIGFISFMKVRSGNSLKWIIIFFTTISLLFLFRTLLAASLFLLFIVFLIRKDNKGKFIFGALIAPCVYYVLFFTKLGNEIQWFIGLFFKGNIGAYLAFLLHSDGLTLTPLIYIEFLVLSLIGPLPSLVSYSSDYLVFLNPGRFLKLLFFPLIILGAYNIAKYSDQFKTLLAFVGINFMGIWFIGFFLIDIFQFVFYPFFLISLVGSLYTPNLFKSVNIIYFAPMTILLIFWNFLL